MNCAEIVVSGGFAAAGRRDSVSGRALSQKLGSCLDTVSTARGSGWVLRSILVRVCLRRTHPTAGGTDCVQVRLSSESDLDSLTVGLYFTRDTQSRGALREGALQW